QWRFTEQPADVACAELFQDVFTPYRRTVARVQTNEITVFSHRVNSVTVHRRSGAWPVATAFIQFLPQSRRPDCFAVGAIQTKDRARVALCSLNVDAVALDHQRAEAVAQVRY